MTHYVRPDHYPLPKGSRTDGLGHDGTSLARKPKQSTAPAGLWAPAPEVVVEKTVKPKSTVGLTQKGNAARQKPCGTEQAAKRHKRHGEPLCDVCEAGRDARRQTTKPRPRPTADAQRCSTKLGYDDHLKRGEPTCQPCRDAMAADARRRAALRKKEPKKPPTADERCGTPKGRPAHRRRNEDPCEPCKTAAYQAERAAYARRAA